MWENNYIEHNCWVIDTINSYDNLIANDPEPPKKGWKSWSNGKRFLWILLNLFTSFIPLVLYLVFPLIKPFLMPKSEPLLSADEKRKASIIENYVFPNEREATVEALIFTKSKMAFLASEKFNRKTLYWTNLWNTKAEQLRQKANIILKNDKVVEDTYAEIQSSKSKVEKSVKIRAIIGAVIIVAFISFVLINGTLFGGVSKLFSGINGGTTTSNEELVWLETGLSTKIPKIEGKEGRVQTNSDTELWISLDGFNYNEFEKYVTDCKEMGYTVDAKKDTNTYTASNEAGYQLEVSCYGEHFSVELKAPLTGDPNFVWPTNTLATLVPTFDNKPGVVETQTEETIKIILYEISNDEVKSYIGKCSSSEFDIDVEKKETSFSGFNSDGCKLSVTYNDRKPSFCIECGEPIVNYKKPAFWIIVVAVVASIVVAVCFLTNPKQDIELGISSQKSGSDLNGVSLEIVDADLSAPDPYIIVDWKNDTDIKLSFGEQFAIYYNQDGTWENCSIEEDPVWNLPAYMFGANSTVKHTYKLNGQIMTHPGEYRFEAPFTIDGKNETKYSAWIEFELKEGVEGITVHTFKPIELVYDDGMYSFVQTVEGAPTYMIVNGMQLIEKTNDTVSEPIGTFEEITLNKDNFDSRFRGPTDYSWLANDTLKSLKDDNKRIWQLYGDSAAETPRLYILLEQKDGTFYLGFGYYNCNSNNPNNPDDSHIRWLYKLEEISESNVGGADGPSNVILIGKPPAMTVSCGKSSVDAWLGTYSWTYKNFEDGTAQSTNADSDHPLVRIDEIPILNILPTTMSAIDPYLASLQFSVVPDKIEVNCYKLDGNKNSKGEPISIDGTSFKLKDGEYLYEVIVEWTKSEQYSGKAHYAFRAVEADLEIVDINSFEKKITAHTTVDTQLYTNSNLTEKALNIPKGTNVYLIETDAKKGAAKAVCGEYIGWIPSKNLKLGKIDTQTSSKDNNLASAISSVLHEKYRAEKPDGLLHIENYYLLANETASGTPLKGNSGHMTKATVYLLVYHMKYSVNSDHLEEVEGDFVPTAITFDVSESGEYKLDEYWTPRSGANYSSDIRAKFPGAAADEALNIEKYAEALTNDSWSQATAYLNSLKKNN